jgi:uncharacterized membrane protein
MDLIVVGFQGRYRAVQVLTELRQRGIRLFDLEQAITVSWEDRRNFIVQQSINLSRHEGARWSRLWGGLIKATLFQPFTEALSYAASTIASGNHKFAGDGAVEVLGRDWWLMEVGIPGDFVRDIGALVRPGESAIISLADHFEANVAIGFLRDCGGSTVYASLNREQTKKIEAVLAAGD